MPTWESADSDAVWTEACTRNRWSGTLETMEEDLRDVPDSTLWELRTAARKKLIDYVRARVSRHLASLGSSPEDIDGVRNLFDGNFLTLGFARRFATYKRPTLLLHDPDRLVRILNDPGRRRLPNHVLEPGARLWFRDHYRPIRAKLYKQWDKTGQVRISQP